MSDPDAPKATDAPSPPNTPSPPEASDPDAVESDRDSDAPHSESAEHAREERRRADKHMGLAIIAVAFVLAVFGSLWAKKAAEPEEAPPPAPVTKVGIPGFPKKVDPVLVLPLARSLTLRSEFRGFVAEGVQSSGKINLEKKRASLRYSFQDPPGKGAQPQRKPGTLPRRAYCGRQRVNLDKTGIVAEPDSPAHPCSSKLKEPLPDPACSLKQVWKHALKKGVGKKKRARIEYYRSNAGPAWRFSVKGTKFSLYGDCGRELTPKEALGNVL